MQEEERTDAPQVAADEIEELTAAASPIGSTAISTAVARSAALTRIVTALTRPKAAMPLAARGSAVRNRR